MKKLIKYSNNFTPVIVKFNNTNDKILEDLKLFFPLFFDDKIISKADISIINLSVSNISDLRQSFFSDINLIPRKEIFVKIIDNFDDYNFKRFQSSFLKKLENGHSTKEKFFLIVRNISEVDETILSRSEYFEIDNSKVKNVETNKLLKMFDKEKLNIFFRRFDEVTNFINSQEKNTLYSTFLKNLNKNNFMISAPIIEFFKSAKFLNLNNTKTLNSKFNDIKAFLVFNIKLIFSLKTKTNKKNLNYFLENVKIFPTWILTIDNNIVLLREVFD